MSIFPKKINKEIDKVVTLHMQINNPYNENIRGEIFFTISFPNNKKNIIKKIVIVKKNSLINKYFKYKIDKNFENGRYWVDGRFLYDYGEAISETKDNDYFDIY